MPEIGAFKGFVDRGDPGAYDKSVGDFTWDDTWRELNLSSIVPSNAKAILVRLYIYDNSIGAYFYIRKKGSLNTINNAQIFTQVSNLGISADCIVKIGSDGIIEYLGIGIAITTFGLTVRGWWI